MYEDKVIELAKAHYENSSEPLLLAEFGKILRQASLWPQGGSKKLADYVSSLAPSVDIMRDPKSPAYAVVVVPGKHHIAESAIRIREERAFLASFPLSVIVAFATTVAGKQKVFLQTREPYKYVRASAPPGDDFLEVPDELRHQGLDVKDITLLPQDNVLTLAASVRAWLTNNGLSDADLKRPSVTARRQKPVATPNSKRPTPASQGGNALQRLFDAQTSEIAAKIVIPLDIANYLSRMD